MLKFEKGFKNPDRRYAIFPIIHGQTEEPVDIEKHDILVLNANLAMCGLSKKVDKPLFICAFCIVLFDKISPLWTNL